MDANIVGSTIARLRKGLSMTQSQLAKELNVENLVLYHTEDKKLPERKKLYSEEAKSVYDGQVFVPYDLERIELK